MRRLGPGQRRKLGSGMTFRVQQCHLVFSAFCLSLILLICFRWWSWTFTFTNHVISLVLFSISAIFCSLWYGWLLTIDIALWFVQRRHALSIFTITCFEQTHMY